MENAYKVGLPNGHIWEYKTKKQAENAKLIARALAAMPVQSPKFGHLGHTNVGKYGQQSALAKELGYFTGKRPRHGDIYNLLDRGNLPRSPERQARLRELAAKVPEDWFETCPCLVEHEKEHQH